ncbi:unnamed protein product [Moneuplotes crassus]|uniref:PX domain-containing protein n=2 Tax=Euplotes crassus TaxID=5936 RepID=A0AAD1X1R8_EUPCR|nr:unnamed protein product [Moneuplotes crassus]
MEQKIPGEGKNSCVLLNSTLNLVEAYFKLFYRVSKRIEQRLYDYQNNSSADSKDLGDQRQNQEETKESYSYYTYSVDNESLDYDMKKYNESMIDNYGQESPIEYDERNEEPSEEVRMRVQQEKEPSKLFYVHQEDERLENLPIISNKKKIESDINHLHDKDSDQHSVSVMGEYRGDPKNFEVLDPQKGSHVAYTVKGYDMEGPFEGKRRYNDFFNLRNLLTARMPGIFIPPIPPKKMMFNKTDKFLEERGYFLQRFLQLTCRVKYIVSSDEFLLFSRPSGDFDKMIETLPKVDAEFLLNRFEKEFKFNFEEDEKEQQENMAVINSYTVFIKKILPILKGIKDQIKPMITERDIQNSNFPDLICLMTQFADCISGNPDSDDSIDSIYIQTANDISEKLKNPFKDYYLWLKGEIYDVQALSDTLESADKLRKTIDKLESKQKSTEAKLDKLNSKKMSFQTLFQKDSTKEESKKTCIEQIAKYKEDIEIYQKLTNICEKHVAREVIPKFKEEKTEIYYKMIQLISVGEIHNCRLATSFWNLLQSQIKKASKDAEE